VRRHFGDAVLFRDALLSVTRFSDGCFGETAVRRGSSTG
jgi:hypothetical protein